VRAFSPALPPAKRTRGGVVAVVDYLTFMIENGDSITSGQTAVPGFDDTVGYTYHDLYTTSDATNLLISENRAVGGTGLSDLITDQANVVTRIQAYPSRDFYIVVVAIGRNDGIYPGSDLAYNGGASWIAQYRTYLTYLRDNAGVTLKIIVNTITPYSNETEPDRVFREVMNDRIRGLVTDDYADAVCDYGNSTTSFMGNVSAHTDYANVYYLDYVHPTRRGHRELYEVFAPVLNACLIKADTVSTPYFTPQGGSVSEALSVTIRSRTSGDNIYYTDDGSTPDATDNLYSTPVLVEETTTLKAIGIKAGLTSSSINSETYTFPVTSLLWNTADAPANGIVWSEGDRLITSGAASNQALFVRGNKVLTGKVLVEVELVTNGYAAIYASLGFLKSDVAIGSDVNSDVDAWARAILFGTMWADEVVVELPIGPNMYWASGESDELAAGDVVLFAIDMDAGKAWARKHAGANGWNTPGSGGLSDPATGTAPHWTWTPGGTWYFAATHNGTSGPAWRLPATGVSTPPSGFTLLNE